MFRAWLALAALVCGVARGAAPSYSAAGIVNASNYTPGPFAPNSVLTLFGTDLASATQALTLADIRDGKMPRSLADVQLRVEGYPAPLFYVSDRQINFLMPRETSREVKVQVVRQSVLGPEVTIQVVDVAPALFQTESGYVIATHADNSLVVPDAPAHAGEIVVVYATGLGIAPAGPSDDEIPTYPQQIPRIGDLKVWLGGVAVASTRIKYAGVTPGSAGLYQINLELPDGLDADPEIRVAIGEQWSAAGAKLAVQ